MLRHPTLVAVKLVGHRKLKQFFQKNEDYQTNVTGSILRALSLYIHITAAAAQHAEMELLIL